MIIREAKFAGSWYTDHKEELQTLIDTMLQNVEAASYKGEIYGLIVPHAAYQFSGNTAAYAYKHLIGKSYEKIFIISPNHRGHPSPFNSVTADVFRTPLGDVAVDQESVKELAASGLIERLDTDQEHAIEIQLPFLQTVLNSFQIVPIMAGLADQNQIKDLMDTIGKISSKKSNLFIASSDLYHEYDYEEVIQKDRALIEAAVKWDGRTIQKLFQENGCTVCGKVPIQLATGLSKRAGAYKIQVLNHTTSGDITGKKDYGEYTVGYLSAAII